MAMQRHLREVAAIGLVALAAVVGPGTRIVSAGGHSRVVYYYGTPSVPVATTSVPVTMVPVATGHGFHHHSAVGAVMVAPASFGWTGQPGMAVAPSGFGAMPAYGAGVTSPVTPAPTYGYGVVGYGVSPTPAYYYPTAIPAAPSPSGSAFASSSRRTGVAADITSLTTNPRYQALAAYMGNDFTRVHALREPARPVQETRPAE